MPTVASINFNTRTLEAIDKVAAQIGKSRSVLVNEILASDPRIVEALKTVAPDAKPQPKIACANGKRAAPVFTVPTNK